MVTELEEAVAAAAAHRAACRSAELQPLLARARERLPAAQAEVGATEAAVQEVVALASAALPVEETDWQPS